MKYIKLIPVSLGIIIVVAALSIVYGFIVHGLFTVRYIFGANFLAAIVFISAGIALMLAPSFFALRKDNLLDHSTYAQRSYDSREARQKKARMVLWLGLITVVLTGLIQLLLSIII